MSERSEHAYWASISTNPVADEEFTAIFKRLQFEPREIGRRFRYEDPAIEHWVYESPSLPRRVKIRVYYTIFGDLVSIGAVGLA